MKQVVLFIVIATFASVPAFGQQQKTTAVQPVPSGHAAVDQGDRPNTLSPHDKITIQTFYRQQAHRERDRGASKKGKGKKEKEIPPGLQKKLDRGGSLPPGWQKKLNRGDVMSLEAYRHARPVPQALSEALPPQPEGTELVQAEDRIFWIMETTREILDVLDVRY